MDEDDSARDDRRAGADGSPTQTSSDNTYLQSAHMGGLDPALEDAAADKAAASDGDAADAAGEDSSVEGLTSDGASGFLYDAGAHFPDLDMTGAATFSVDGPEWIAIDPATGLLTGAPSLGEVGVFAFTVTVEDAAGVRYETTLEFTIAAADGAPVVTQVVAADASAAAEEEVVADAVATDELAVEPPAEQAAVDEPKLADTPESSSPKIGAGDSDPVAPQVPQASPPKQVVEQTPVQDLAPAEPPAGPAVVPASPPVELAPVAPDVETPTPTPPAAEEPPVVVAPEEAAAPAVPVNEIKGTKNADFLVGTSGNDRIAGLAGNDRMKGGAGDDEYVFGKGKSGSDVFDDGGKGDGYDVAVATESGVVIGVDGYNDGRSFSSKGVTVKSTGVDAFDGAGDTIIRDGGSARTLNFSNTKLEGILEIDAAGGNDTVIASDLSDASYRGGAGNDSLTAGDANATWLYSGSKNGSDTFVNGEGSSVAQAEGGKVVIGVNGYANGVDAFAGAGDTVIRDGGSSRTLDFSNTELKGVLEIDAAGGNDTVVASDLSDAAYRGGAGNDSLTAGDANATWLYSGSKNGSDTFVNGDGHSVAQADGGKVVIGVNGYANGVDAFAGAGDTVIRDSNSSRTLDFSDTELKGVLEIDAAGGNDTVIASDLSDGAYRGGDGNDALTAGDANATWLYSGSKNGSDTFVNGDGYSVAEASGKGVVIGVNGYANGVDAFAGAGDTVIRDSGSSRTLDFSNTELTGVLQIDAAGGNDTLLASNLSDGEYRGGAGDDSLTAGSQRSVWLYGSGDNGSDTFVNGAGVSIAQADGEGVVIGVNGYANGVDGFEGAGDTVIRDGNGSRTLDFSDTAFKDVAEIDARGGNDTIVASDLSEAAYRGGAGNDALTAGDQRTVWVYGSGDNGLDTFTNGKGESLAQADDEGVVIGVNGYANGVDGVLGVGDTVIRDGGGSRTLNFSDTAFKGVAEIDGAGGADRITVSNVSETSYRGGAGADVFVVEKGAASASIVDFDDAGNDKIDLSAFGEHRDAIAKATSMADVDGDGQADDVQIDLSALGGEKGATLSLLDTDMTALNFGAKGDFVGFGDKGAAFKSEQALELSGDAAGDQLFAFDMDSLDPDSGWTAALDGGSDAFADAGMDVSGVIVFEDGSDSVFASINDSQWS